MSKKSSFEMDAYVDIEAIMAAIRQRAENRRHSSPEGPAICGTLDFAMPIDPEGPRTSLTPNNGRLSESFGKPREAESSLPSEADAVAQVQADFNQAIVRSLTVVTQSFQRLAGDFCALERRMVSEAVRNQRESEQTTQHIVANIVSAALEEANTKVEGVVQAVKEMQENMTRELNHVSKGIQERINEFERKLVEVELSARMGREIKEEVIALSATTEEIREQTRTAVSQAVEFENKVAHRLDEIRMRILRAERSSQVAGPQSRAPQPSGEFDRSPKPISSDYLPANGNGKRRAKAVGAGTSPLFDYFKFEHNFRGPLAEIKRSQAHYLDLFLGRTHVLDLGCGRGEFVELLSENGVSVKGVDNNQDMVEFCRDRGLPVELSDIFDFLSNLPDASVDAIFSSQVIEHFPPDQILELIDMCGKKLRTGGLIVIETVNTDCPEALSNFYFDPTHIRPVPPKLLRFILEEAAFRLHSFRFSAPVSQSNASPVFQIRSELPKEISSYQDYAAVAIRR